MPNLSSNPFVNEVLQAAEDIRFPGLVLVSEKYAPESFGNATATFKWRSLLLNFSRDRSVDHLDIADAAHPGNQYFGDLLFVFLGLDSLDDLLRRDGKAPTARSWLLRLAENAEQIEAAFSPERRKETIASLEELFCRFNARRQGGDRRRSP